MATSEFIEEDPANPPIGQVRRSFADEELNMFKLQEAAFLKKSIPGERTFKRLLAQASLFSQRCAHASVPMMSRMATKSVAKRDEESKAAWPDFVESSYSGEDSEVSEDDRADATGVVQIIEDDDL